MASTATLKYGPNILIANGGGVARPLSSVPKSWDGLIFVKRRALFLAKIRALDGQKEGQKSISQQKELQFLQNFKVSF